MPLPFDLAHAFLTAALGFAFLGTRDKPGPPEAQRVRKWLDNWTGVSHLVTGMNRRGFRLPLTNVDESVWRGRFSIAAMLRADGFGTGPTAGRAVQVAAWKMIGWGNPCA